MLFAVGCYHCGYIEVSPLSDPNSAVPVSKRTCERRATHCSATLWDYVPSVAKPIVGFLGVDLSVPVSNAVSINCSSGDKFVSINSWKQSTLCTKSVQQTEGNPGRLRSW